MADNDALAQRKLRSALLISSHIYRHSRIAAFRCLILFGRITYACFSASCARVNEGRRRLMIYFWAR